MADPDFTQFKLVHKGHSFEDFHEGQVFEHHWGRTINAGDNSLFTTATLAHPDLFQHGVCARARPSRHGGQCDAGVVHRGRPLGRGPERGGGPFLGVDDLKFVRPVYPGETLVARSTVVYKRESPAAAITGS